MNSISGFLIRLYAQCAADRSDLTNQGSFSAFSKRILAAKEAAGFLFGGIAEIFDALGASCRDQILFKNIADLKQALVMKALQQGKLRRM